MGLEKYLSLPQIERGLSPYLTMVWDDIVNADAFVSGSASDVSLWNIALGVTILPLQFASATVTGNIVKLSGGSAFQFTSSLFKNITHILGIDSNIIGLTADGNSTFKNSGALSLNLRTLINVPDGFFAFNSPTNASGINLIDLSSAVSLGNGVFDKITNETGVMKIPTVLRSNSNVTDFEGANPDFTIISV